MGLNDTLHGLFLVDQQVRGLESRLDGARQHVRAQQIKIEQLTRQRDEVAHRLKHAQATAANLENDANAFEQRIAKLREQMNNAKTNKEYSAFLVEVNTLKAEKAKIEDQTLEEMTRIDGLKEELAALEARLADQQKIRERADRELAERQSEVAGRLEELKTERAEAAAKVPTDALAVFDRLADQFEGEAMAPVIEADRRRLEYGCGGCFMQIPVERVNQLATQDVLVQCPSCQRMLYLEPELREAMGVSKS